MRAAKCFYFLSIVIFLTMLPVPRISAARGTHQSVGLVLSGGGAKGIAHIGVIKALEDNDIPIDCITGTSMGAIVGGLYACGYTTDEMMSLLLSPYFTAMSTGTADPSFTYYFTEEQPTPRMFSIPLGRSDTIASKRFNPQSVIAPTPMSFGFMELFSSYMAQCGGDFNKLFVPYRCVASNISKRRAEIHRSGNLGDCIRSSMSFPLVFQPVLMNGDMLVDGGLYCNFPVDVMIDEFKPDILLGVDVSAPDVWPPNSFLDELSTLVEQPQSYEVPADKGMRLRIDLTEFGLLDFGKAQEIYNIGYEHALAMMDSIKGRVHGRRDSSEVANHRRAFKSSTPPLRFSSVKVEGGTESQNAFLESFFRPAKGCDTIGIDHARLAFYRAYSSGKLKSLYPQATLRDGHEGLFDLSLQATVKNKFQAGLGAFITSSTNSYLYVSASYSTLSFSSLSAAVEAWIGQSYMAGAVKANLQLPTPMPSALFLEGVASRTRYSESEKLFFRDTDPTFVIRHEYFGKVSWGMAAGRKGRFGAGIGGAHLFNSFYRNSSPESYMAGRDHETMNLGQVYLGADFNTIDSDNYPTSGWRHTARLAGVAGKSHFTTPIENENSHVSHSRAWVQLDLATRNYFSLHRNWALGVEGRAVLSTRPLLENYYASLSMAPAYNPTPASNNSFDTGRRANSYVAAGIVPVWKATSALSLRLNLNGFVPLRSFVMTEGGGVRYGRTFGRAEFFGEFDAVYSLPFGNVCAYCNYSSSHTRWNVGLSLGIYLKAPTFL